MLKNEQYEKLCEAIDLYNQGKHQEAYEIFVTLVEPGIDDDEAQYYMGVMYFNGHYVEKDKDEAIYWWKKSARSRNQDAAFQLESLSMSRNTRY